MFNDLAGYFKALADPTRLRILQLLGEREMCVCELEEFLNMSQPAVSHHLRLLKKAGLVDDRREGKWIYYSLNGHNLLAAEDRFDEMLVAAVRGRLAAGLPAAPRKTEKGAVCARREKAATGRRKTG